MFTTNDFNVGDVVVLMDVQGRRVIGRVRKINHMSNIIELNAYTGHSNTGRYAIRCAYIETAGIL